eukprot:m.17300 g.17300  ORF g.17300 m.17300 type:complete len:82 (+) comp4761_c0_seq1:69-314(+)
MFSIKKMNKLRDQLLFQYNLCRGQEGKFHSLSMDMISVSIGELFGESFKFTPSSLPNPNFEFSVSPAYSNTFPVLSKTACA